MKRKTLLILYMLITALILPQLFSVRVLAYTREEADSVIDSIPADWPDAPEISATAAILIDADSGEILYAKNATDTRYPASTTKLMTALLTLENASLSDVVTFSSKAVSIPSGSSHIGMRRGESMVLKECLLGLLLPSANEVANALAEHVAGSIEAFVSLMNVKAEELGCVNTHFANANGLHDENHYTCCYDLALIMQACSSNNIFNYLSGTSSYVHHADDLLDKDIPMTNTNLMVRPSSEYYDEYVVSGKTGHTDESGYNLVIYAEKDGVRLISVVMGCESGEEYVSTRSLLDYGFNYFHLVLPAELDEALDTDISFTSSSLQIPTRSEALLSINNTDSILLPENVTFDMLEKVVTETDDGKYITYSYQGYPLGSVLLTGSEKSTDSAMFKAEDTDVISPPSWEALISIDGWLVLAILVLILLFVIMTLILVRIKGPYKNRGRFRNL